MGFGQTMSQAVQAKEVQSQETTLQLITAHELKSKTSESPFLYKSYFIHANKLI